MDETSKVLNSDEKIVWSGQPQFLPYVFSALPLVIFGVVWLSFLTLIGYYVIFKSTNAPVFAFAMLGIFLIIGLILLLGSPIYAMLVYKHIWYVITDKRVILQTGLIGRDFDFVDYDKVESSTVNVGLKDKLFGKNSGTILIYANRLQVQSFEDSHGRNRTATVNVPFTLMGITDPYVVFDLFKKTSFNVKTDMTYPNALRPAENPGYQTVYNPNDAK